jgi:methylenetetrahydrofolate dehydrogenase (NADP+) / methenyltetrahydrofolate cyclohydrolase
MSAHEEARMALIIDGKALAKQVRQELKEEVASLTARGVVPGLAVVLVGDDPGSAIYVRNKTKACQQAGIAHFDHLLPATATASDLLRLVDRLNADRAVHGVLVQLPLPPGLDATPILTAIDPAKDVDGYHPINLGRLVAGAPTFVPCTPAGILRMLHHAQTPLCGAEAVVVGRSVMVGKPMGLLLLAEHCTVTWCHSRTVDLAATVGRADIVVVAAGRAELIKGAWIRPGATVIDVGINRVGEKVIGDVEFAPAAERARAISPVPGGVGPMTVAMLLSNTVRAARSVAR